MSADSSSAVDTKMEPEELEILKLQVSLALRKMSDDERREFLSSLSDEYCRYCGGKEGYRNCQCWNDE